MLLGRGVYYEEVEFFFVSGDYLVYSFVVRYFIFFLEDGIGLVRGRRVGFGGERRRFVGDELAV